MKWIPQPFQPSLDILFVIDESPSMADNLESIRVNYRRFVAVLENIEGGLPDVHLGVVSADLARAGVLEGYLADRVNPDGTHTVNYLGNLGDAFASLASLGAGAADRAQPLEAMRRALDGSNAVNAAFLRADAFLLVVFVTAQDDCSAVDPTWAAGATAFDCLQAGTVCGGAPLDGSPGTHTDCVASASPALHDLDEYADFLKSTRADPRMVIISLVTPNPGPVTVTVGPVLEPSCVSGAGVGTPAVRLRAFAERFPDRWSLASICNEDVSDALILVTGGGGWPAANPCLEATIDATDLHLEQPGLQLDCAVTDDVFSDGSSTSTVLPRCELAADGGSPVPEQPRPCWWVEEDLLNCPPPSSAGLLLRVERAGWPPMGTMLKARCACER